MYLKSSSYILTISGEPDEMPPPGIMLLIYFIPQAPTSDLNSSRKDVRTTCIFSNSAKCRYFFLLSDNSAVILFSKVYWFDSLNSFLSFKINKYSFLTGATFPSSKDDFCAYG